MGRVILCMGQKAQTPYCFEKLGIRVWTVEELCFCLKENAFLLDTEIVSAELARWIEEQCELTELAGILYPMVRHQASTAAFVIKILEYTGLYDTQTMTEVSRTLQSGASLSDYEKKKKRGDFLVQHQKYSKALMEYDCLLTELPAAEKEVRAGVLHNKAVALTQLFDFEGAARYFYQAWQLDARQDFYRDYLAAKRMQYDDKEYISFVAELPEAYELSLQLEQEVDRILENWENGIDYQKLSELFALKTEQANLYYDEIDVRVQALKEAYRECSQL